MFTLSKRGAKTRKGPKTRGNGVFGGCQNGCHVFPKVAHPATGTSSATGVCPKVAREWHPLQNKSQTAVRPVDPCFRGGAARCCGGRAPRAKRPKCPQQTPTKQGPHVHGWLGTLYNKCETPASASFVPLVSFGVAHPVPSGPKCHRKRATSSVQPYDRPPPAGGGHSLPDPLSDMHFTAKATAETPTRAGPRPQSLGNPRKWVMARARKGPARGPGRSPRTTRKPREIVGGTTWPRRASCGQAG